MGDEKQGDIELKREKTRAALAQDMGCSTVVVVAGVCIASVKIMSEAFDTSSPWWGAIAVVALSAMGATAAAFLLRK